MEELKVVLETMVSLGGEAKWLFILWIIGEFLENALIASCFGVLFYGGYRLVRIWQKHEFEE